MSPCLWLVVFLLVPARVSAACPPDGTPVTVDTHAVGCADLRLTVTADNVTLVIEGATGSINVTSDAAGTTLRLLDSTVAGNVTLGGPHAFADVRRSTVTGADVVVLSGARNATIAVVDSTLTGAVVASVLSSAVGVSLTISNSTLSATRYAASVVGATIRDVAIAVTDSRLTLAGADNVGVVALAAAAVFNAAVNVTASSVTCKAGSYVGVLGAGSNSGAVTWTNVTVSAALANVTSTAGSAVGVLGAGSYSGAVTWTNVTVSAALANVTSTATGNYVGVLGAGNSNDVTWTNVTVSAALANVTSTAANYVGVLGAGSYYGVTWTNVTVSAALANVTSTAANYVGVLGAGSSSGVTWTSVTVSAALVNVTSTAANYVAVLGAGSDSDVRWTSVTVSAAFANVTSTAANCVGVLGAGSPSRGSWTNVTVSAALAYVTSTAGSVVGVLGAGTNNGASSWTNVTVSAAFANVTSTAANCVGVLGAGSVSDVTWTNVTVSAALANVTSTATERVGVLGAGSVSDVTWANVTISAALANVTSTAGSVVGILGAGSYNGASSWTNVTVSAAFANVASTAANCVGVLGAGSTRGVTWTNVTVCAALATISSTAGERVGVLGAGSYNDVSWTNVTVSAALANVTSTARDAVGALGAGSYVSVAAGATATAVWTGVAVVLVDSTLACRSASVSGVLGASIAARDPSNPTSNGSVNVAWRGVVVVAAASGVGVWAGERAAVLGASADDGAWDGVFAGAVEASRVFARVGSVGCTLGAPGLWRDAVLGNGSAAIDANSTVLCSNRTVDNCVASELPDHVAALLDRARRLDLCGRARLSATGTATASQTDTATATTTPSETSTATTSRTMANTTFGTAAASTTTTTTTEGRVPSTTALGSTAAIAVTKLSTAANMSVTTASATNRSQTDVFVNGSSSPAPGNTSAYSVVNGSSSSSSLDGVTTTSLAVASVAQGAYSVIFSPPLRANKAATLSRMRDTMEACANADATPTKPGWAQFVWDGGGEFKGAVASTTGMQLFTFATGCVVYVAAECKRQAHRAKHASRTTVPDADGFQPKLPSLIRMARALYIASSLYYTPSVASGSVYLVMSPFGDQDVLVGIVGWLAAALLTATMVASAVAGGSAGSNTESQQPQEEGAAGFSGSAAGVEQGIGGSDGDVPCRPSPSGERHASARPSTSRRMALAALVECHAPMFEGLRPSVAARLYVVVDAMAAAVIGSLSMLPMLSNKMMTCSASAWAIAGACVVQFAYLAIVQPFEGRMDMASAVALLVTNGAASVACAAILGRAAPEAPSEDDVLLMDQLTLAATSVFFADLAVAIGMNIYECVTMRGEKRNDGKPTFSAPIVANIEASVPTGDDERRSEEPLLTVHARVIAPRGNPLAAK